MFLRTGNIDIVTDYNKMISKIIMPNLLRYQGHFNDTEINSVR